MSKIKPEDVENALKLSRDYSQARDKISNRLKEILKHINKSKHLWFQMCDVGQFDDNIYFQYESDVNCRFLDRDGNLLELFDGALPIRWLYEDFEEEVANGKEAYKEQEKQRKLEKNQKTTNQSALKKSAKAKLTKEEIEALGL